MFASEKQNILNDVSFIIFKFSFKPIFLIKFKLFHIQN